MRGNNGIWKVVVLCARAWGEKAISNALPKQ
jgi:hypothetical protein